MTPERRDQIARRAHAAIVAAGQGMTLQVISECLYAACKEIGEEHLEVVRKVIHRHDVEDGMECRKMGFCECFGVTSLDAIMADMKKLSP